MPRIDDASPGPIYDTRASLDAHTYSIGKSGRTKINHGG